MIDALQASMESNLAVRVTRLYVPSKGSSGPIVIYHRLGVDDHGTGACITYRGWVTTWQGLVVRGLTCMIEKGKEGSPCVLFFGFPTARLTILAVCHATK